MTTPPVDSAASLASAPLVAHGLAVRVEDVPLPLAVFYAAAIGVLAASFLLLAVLWRGERWSRDACEARGGPAPAPRLIGALADARWPRVLLGGLAMCWLVVTVGSALFGSTETGENPAPSLVFVLGWIGLAPLAAILGRGALCAHPIGAVARAARMDEHAGPGSTAPPLPPRVGVWPAWLGLALFVWLELVAPTASHVRLLGALVLAWAVFTLIACSRWGVATWLRRGDPFGTYATLLASLAPWERRADRRLGWRAPGSGAARDVAPAPGLVPLVTLLIGSVSYDGLSRTGWWSVRVGTAVSRLGERGVGAPAARVLFGTFGMVMLVLVAWLAFELASAASARIGRLRTGRGSGPANRIAQHPDPGTARPAQAFAASLLPIALAYVVAHYFAFFVVQVQDLPRLLADPLDRGWDLGPLGALRERTALDLWRPPGAVAWSVQVGAIVVGHVLGLLLAHDRALELAPRGPDGAPDLRRAALSQLPMLALMLLYTVGGLYFLSEGLT